MSALAQLVKRSLDGILRADAGPAEVREFVRTYRRVERAPELFRASLAGLSDVESSLVWTQLVTAPATAFGHISRLRRAPESSDDPALAQDAHELAVAVAKFPATRGR